MNVFISGVTRASRGSGFDSHYHVTTLGKLFTHTDASVVNRYNLVMAKGRWSCEALKITVSQAESNSSYRHLRDSVTRGLTAHRPSVSSSHNAHIKYGSILN